MIKSSYHITVNKYTFKEKTMDKKNILIILADQLRPDFCGCYGADWLKTPNIDEIARNSVQYNCAISPSPACVPARGSFFTGKSAIENRVTDNAKWLRPDHDVMGIHTWATQLSEIGYHTAAIGKMHFYPWDISEGFQYRLIAEDKRHTGIQDDYTIFLKKHGYKRLHAKVCDGYYENKGAVVNYLPEELTIDRYVCNQTCEYLDILEEGKPFAMMVGFPGPHCPYDPSQEMLDKMPDVPMPKAVKGTKETDVFRIKNIQDNSMPWNGVDLNEFTEEQIQKVRRHYSALVQGIDEYVGIIIDKLKALGMYEDTIIMFTSDHGDYLGDFGMAGKAHFYESSCRIPLLIKYPDQEPTKIDHAVSLTDCYATILNFAGIETADTSDSTMLAPFGKSETRERILGSNQMGWMLRDKDYQYTMYYNGIRELYDLNADPTQQHNVIDHEDYKEISAEMRDELIIRVFDAMNKGNTDITAIDNNMNRVGENPFDHQGWKRTYPHSKLSM